MLRDAAPRGVGSPRAPQSGRRVSMIALFIPTPTLNAYEYYICDPHSARSLMNNTFMIFVLDVEIKAL